jgi:hypothetical protein
MVSLKKLSSNEDFKTIENFLFYSVVFGSIFNFALFIAFKIPFTYYSFLGWGMLIWLIENKFVRIIRSLYMK